MSSSFVRDVSIDVQMAKTDRIKVWGMLYCGGAAPVMKALEEIPPITHPDLRIAAAHRAAPVGHALDLLQSEESLLRDLP